MAVDQHLETELSKDLTDLFQCAGRAFGGNTIMQRVKSILYFEPDAMCLEDIAQKSGYSLSATSTALKILEDLGAVERRKKPGSRKLHYYMYKDLGVSMLQFMKKAAKSISAAQNLTPQLIEKYKRKVAKSKNKQLKEKFAIIQEYQKQLSFLHNLFNQHVEALERHTGNI